MDIKKHDVEMIMTLIGGYCDRDYILGGKDRGFAINVLLEFVSYLEENGYEISIGKSA